MQFPLDAQAEFWKQMVADWVEALPTSNPTVPALSELAQRLNGTILISHSQSGIYPFQTAVLSTKGIAGIISIEPAACPASTDDMRPFAGLPILVLFGDYVDQFSALAPRMKTCRDFAQAANRAGARAEVIALPDVGFPRQLAHVDAGQEQPAGRRLAPGVDRQSHRSSSPMMLQALHFDRRDDEGDEFANSSAAPHSCRPGSTRTASIVVSSSPRPSPPSRARSSCLPSVSTSNGSNGTRTSSACPGEIAHDVMSRGFAYRAFEGALQKHRRQCPLTSGSHHRALVASVSVLVSSTAALSSTGTNSSHASHTLPVGSAATWT
jgi:hypothetical protein